jgi:hypothetical protein
VNDLVFGPPPLAGPPFNLVFGDDGGVGPPPPQASPTALVFRRPPLGPLPPIHLVFGDDDDGGVIPPPPADVELRLAAALPGLGAAFALSYLSGAPRGPAAATAARFQPARPRPAGVSDRAQAMARLPGGATTRHQQALPLGEWVRVSLLDTLTRQHVARAARHQDAQRVGAWPLALASQGGWRRGHWRTARFESARRMSAAPARDRWRDRLRDRRPVRLQRWQVAAPAPRGWTTDFGPGAWRPVGWAARFQAGIEPPPGMRAGVLPPEPPEPPDPCYLPDPHLLFAQAWAGGVGGAELLFVCERHPIQPPKPPLVVVPVKRVYIVLNTVSLRRVADDADIPVLSLALSIDVDSWTWGFNATIPGAALALVAPGEDGPVELEAVVNGGAYRVLAEQISRDRAFNSSTVRVQGRGKSALLASPYSPTRSHGNSIARTAQQLMADVLSWNNQPIGWDVDWRIDDWLVSAGAFAMNGAYIDGLTAIAGAAGAYLQPHPTAQTLRVLPRYPVAPWHWGEVTPDIELPDAVTLQEGIEWTERPAYNRVFVSGASQGILGQVTRAGTAGDLVAEMVTDALITAPEAARQRGIAILGDTGRQARVSLRLPVLAETGVIVPGQFVRYVDNGAGLHRLGLVRATAVDAGFPEVWQTIQVETHP